MVIHIIGTVNGQTNEGMRNVATHLAREFEKEHRVICSGLREIPRIVYRSSRADATMIFARASRRVYSLGWLVSRLCKNTWIVLVQKPEEGFLERNRRRPLGCHYLSITEGDMAQLETLPGKRKQVFPVGIDPEKFRPVEAEQQRRLKEKYGFDPDQPLVIHVGHCSKGRGLEDFTRISGAQRMVAASGMFEDETVMKTLRQAGVKIHKGYLEHVEEVYQMADAYLFPTRSGEYVISIPLSVMEALSCGVPVVGYKSFANLREIPGAAEAMELMEEAGDLDKILARVIGRKRETSLLKKAVTWQEAAREVLEMVQEERR